ncbi:MAG TPA: ATP-dependent Clp protease adaptor ClpS [Patescibacteria group bacterium]|nr:ATP-dependent Clp protease adaptor ClpS [Patescibacteria group bacterium]
MSAPPQIQRQIKRQQEADPQEELERLYRVIIHNDDVTPYDFVIIILVRFFQLDVPAAELVTWTAHTSGIAQVVILPLSEARRRVGRAHFAAAVEGFPLSFTIEPE